MRAALGLLRRMAEELNNAGTYSALDAAPSYAEINELLNQNQR